MAALDEAARLDRRSRATVILIAIEEYLTRRGVWLPPDAD